MSFNEELVINRPKYIELLSSLISEKTIKVITGLRRSGKSYLLEHLFKPFLIKEKGYTEDNFLILKLNSDDFGIDNPVLLIDTIKQRLKPQTSIIFIDEVQRAGDGYADALIAFMNTNPDISIFVTGSNSFTLSIDVNKAFKENAHEIFLTAPSYFEVKKCIPSFSVNEYFKYGSLPIILKYSQDERIKRLDELYRQTYIVDINSRYQNKLLSQTAKERIIEHIFSNLTSPVSENELIGIIANKATIKGKEYVETKATISDFIKAVTDSFLMLDFVDGYIYKETTKEEYIDKYIKKYCFDIGLLSVISKAKPYNKLPAIIENAVFLELINKGFDVEGKEVTKQDGGVCRIDFFYVDKKNNKNYIQVTYELNERNKEREIGNLSFDEPDSIKTCVYFNNVLTDSFDGISLIQIEDFLLQK